MKFKFFLRSYMIKEYVKQLNSCIILPNASVVRIKIIDCHIFEWFIRCLSEIYSCNFKLFDFSETLILLWYLDNIFSSYSQWSCLKISEAQGAKLTIISASFSSKSLNLRINLKILSASSLSSSSKVADVKHKSSRET